MPSWINSISVIFSSSIMQSALSSRTMLRAPLRTSIITLSARHVRPFSVSSASYLHLWDHLPGESVKVPSEGLAKLKGRIREERFRLKPLLNTGEHDRFDVVVGK